MYGEASFGMAIPAGHISGRPGRDGGTAPRRAPPILTAAIRAWPTADVGCMVETALGLRVRRGVVELREGTGNTVGAAESRFGLGKSTPWCASRSGRWIRCLD